MPSFDTSIYHPMFHNVLDAECSEWPGGRRRHIALWWDYQAKPRMRRETLCRFGKHQVIGYWRSFPSTLDAPYDGYECGTCGREKP